MPRSDFVYIYGFYFLFLSQYLAAVALFCFSFPRRRLFLPRLVASLAVCAGLACIWSDAAKAYTVLIILRYFVLFMAGFGPFCFALTSPR